MPSVQDYEKLGSFYLGKKYDLAGRKLLDDLVNYDSKDLVTHALCVGMTGSGKTGLCLSLLEEAAIDGVPAICIDPKGDLGNLLLAFPNLAPSDFQEWIEPAEATRQGKPMEELATETANRWRKGLSDWHQEPDRIQRYRDSVDITIFTPGSNIGVPMTVLKSFDAPSVAVREDVETMREKVASASSGLLTLLGIDADPLTSREHILLSNIFDQAWKNGINLSLEDLIRQIQSPPIKKIGVIDLDSFYSPADRAKLSMSLEYAEPSTEAEQGDRQLLDRSGAVAVRRAGRRVCATVGEREHEQVWMVTERCGAAGRTSERKAEDYLPLTDDVLASHLRGDATIGIYPLLRGDTCTLLAVRLRRRQLGARRAGVPRSAPRSGVPAVFAPRRRRHVTERRTKPDCWSSEGWVRDRCWPIGPGAAQPSSPAGTGFDRLGQDALAG